MSKKKELPKIEMKLREVKHFKESNDLFEFIQNHNINGYEFACGWYEGNMKNKCWLKRMK